MECVFDEGKAKGEEGSEYVGKECLLCMTNKHYLIFFIIGLTGQSDFIIYGQKLKKNIGMKPRFADKPHKIKLTPRTLRPRSSLA